MEREEGLPNSGLAAPEAPFPGFLELMYGALFAPVTTFRQVAARPRPDRAVLVLLAVSVVSAGAGALSAEREAGLAALPVSLSLGPVAFLLGLIGPFVIWYLQASALHLTAELLGGAGRVLTLLTLLALAAVPQVFSAPALLLGVLTRSSLGGWLSLGIGVWVIVLQVLAVRETYGFSTGRAVGTLFLPLGALVALTVAVAVALAASFWPLFQQFLPGPGAPLP